LDNTDFRRDGHFRRQCWQPEFDIDWRRRVARQRNGAAALVEAFTSDQQFVGSGWHAVQRELALRVGVRRRDRQLTGAEQADRRLRHGSAGIVFDCT
jgi:hypothetical protein